MRLIDADEFFKDFTELEPYEHISHEYDIDAVEVVRCKDCKYKPSWREGVKEEFRDGFELIFPDWRDNPCPCQCDDGFYAHMPDDNWFCADGKAR